MAYLRQVLTPNQQEPADARQVPNSAGGYSYPLDDWKRLERFLILGSEGGSYYASERQLTQENAQVAGRCIQQDGVRAVEVIEAISDAGRAPKNDPAIFALAMAVSYGSDETRREALAAIPTVCRTGTHLAHFAAYVQEMRGWGRGLRSAIANWYLSKTPDQVAYQALKYRQRDGWSHRDLLRLAHPHKATHDPVFRWIVKGELLEGVPEQLVAFEKLQNAHDKKTVVALLGESGLPWEAVPDRWLREPDVWHAMLDQLGYTALIRSLSRLTRIGYIAPMSNGLHRVLGKLAEPGGLRKARVHPIQVLAALLSYKGGKSRGDRTWEPVAQVIDALDEAFYEAFGNVEPSGKRTLLALDVSGSMGAGTVAGVDGLTPRVAASALAMMTARTEPAHHLMAFSHEFVPLVISPGERLDDIVVRTASLPFGGTDCALPMVWARDNHVPVDIFVVYTDSETWYGAIHPMAALREYRQRMGIPAKLVVCGMVSNGFTIADTEDGGALDVVGFDLATPQLITDFAS